MAVEAPALWVFGYGSLIWNPGFPFIERLPARVFGYHRTLCVYSHVHRGTRDAPGLVLGLDRGGSCKGVAFQVEARHREETLNYLRARELVTNVYHEAHLEVRFDSGRRTHAVTYVVDKLHAQYAGRLSLPRQLELIRQGRGQSGLNRDYVLATADHLRDLKIKDHGLEWLAQELQNTTAA